MSLFGKVFGNRAKAARPTADLVERHAPGTEISYDPQIISKFKGHHQSLLKLYKNIVAAAEDKDYSRLHDLLKKFLNALMQHVLEENLKFYVYLEKCIDDEDHRNMIGDMKQEMTQIGREVRRFIRHHLDYGINDDNVEKFRVELEGVGNVLKDRIQREEDGLYPLYLPPRNYDAL